MMECTDADVDEKIDRHRRRQQQKDPCENESIGCNYWEVIKYGLGEDIVLVSACLPVDLELQKMRGSSLSNNSPHTGRNSAYVTIKQRPDGSMVDANRHRDWIKFQ